MAVCSVRGGRGILIDLIARCDGPYRAKPATATGYCHAHMGVVKHLEEASRVEGCPIGPEHRQVVSQDVACSNPA